MNLSSLRDRVRSLTGIRLESLRSDEQIDTVLNESYQEVTSMTNWPFLRGEASVSVAAGAENFQTPSGFTEVSSVTYASGQQAQTRLRQTTMDELDYLDQDEEGDPVYYARVDEDTFRVWPAPVSSTTFFIRGKIVVTNLSSDSSQPVFAEQFHPILAYRAAARILAEEGDDSGRSEFYQNEANILFSRMNQFYLRSADVGVFTMGGRRRKTLNAY